MASRAGFELHTSSINMKNSNLMNLIEIVDAQELFVLEMNLCVVCP
jgi:hypothetical protein